MPRRIPLLLLVLSAFASGCSLIDSTNGLTGGPAETSFSPEDPIDGGGGIALADSAAISRGSDASASTNGDTDSASHATSPSSTDDGGAPPGADASTGADSAAPSSGDAAAAPDTSTVPVAPTAIYTSLLSPLGIAVSAGTLCWTAGDTFRGIYCAPSIGAPASDIRTIATQASDSNAANAFDVALDSANVYWSNGPDVIRKPLSGGASSAYFNGLRLAYLATDPAASDAGATSIWASDFAVPGSGAAGADILIGPIPTNTSEYLYEGEPGAAGVAVFGNTVFWGRDESPGYVAFGPKEGKATSTPVAAAGPVTGVAVDRAGTLFFLVSDRYVYSLPLGSTKSALVYDAGTTLGGGDVAVDDEAVYLSEHDPGVIMRLPK
jgi:hypothetical protein